MEIAQLIIMILELLTCVITLLITSKQCRSKKYKRKVTQKDKLIRNKKRTNDK